MNRPTLEAAHEELELGHTAAATQILETLVKLEPHVALVHEGLAMCYFADRRWAKAIDAALEALRLDDGLVIPHRILANAYMRQRRHEESAEELKRILGKSPGDWEVQIALGNVLVAAGKVQEGIEAFEQARDIAPSEWLPYYHLASGYTRLGDRGRTYGALQSALIRRRSIATAFLFVSAFMSFNRVWVLPAVLICLLGSLILPFPLWLAPAFVISTMIGWSAVAHLALRDLWGFALSAVMLTFYLGLIYLRTVA